MRPKQKLFIITHKKIIIYFKLYYMVLINYCLDKSFNKNNK